MDGGSALTQKVAPATVLHVRVVTGSGGGPDKTILASATHLSSPAFNTLAAFMHPPHDPGYAALQRRACAYGCPLIDIVDRGALDMRVLVQLLQWCRVLRVRIWHGHDYKSNVLGLLLRRVHRMRLVTTMHGWVENTGRTRIYHRIDRSCLRYYDHVIAVSSELQAHAVASGIAIAHCSLIPNAIDERLFRRSGPAERSAMRQQLGVPSGRQIIGAVGRLSPEKGFHHLVRAVGGLVSRGADVELWIAGVGRAKAALERLVAEMGLQSRVRLLGFVEDIVELFEAFDVFALSSVDEGMPNALLEAMSMAVPAVATRVGGVPAMITDGENGLLCDPGDVRALEDRLWRMIREPPLREALAQGARQTIEVRFTLAQRVARELAVYEQVLGASRGIA